MSNFKYFKLSEFKCKCGCNMPDEVVENLTTKLISLLDIAREKSRIPFIITSGYRCPEYNELVGGVKNSAHTKGLAADIKVGSGYQRYAILKSLLDVGFTRIGIYRNFIHCDVDYTKPSPVIWIRE